MNKEKQIEELRNEVQAIFADLVEGGIAEYENECLVVGLYNAGYRKQSEGEWENVYEYNAYEMRRERKTACSQCGYKPKGDIFEKTPFCPNCGAKMKGE